MIGMIENAILARLAGSDFGYKLSVESYGGQLDDTETLTGLLGQLPGCWVLANGLGDPTDVPGGRMVPITFTIFLVCKNLRNEAASRHGGKAGEIGAYQLILDIRNALRDSRFGLEIDPLRPRRVRTLFNGKLKTTRTSVWACDFETAWFEDDIPAEDRADGNEAPFHTFHAYWDVPPLGNVQPPLPPAVADAEDIVTLPTEDA